MNKTVLMIAPLVLAACSGGAADEPDNAFPAAPDSGDAAAGTRPAGEPNLVTYEGRIEAGTECRVLHTPDGELWAFNAPDADLAVGDYVRITGEVADASFCMEGQGTLVVDSIAPADPPARDRDPAQSGGLAVTTEYVKGSWVAKGVNADCDNPDFTVTTNSNGMALFEGPVNGKSETAPLSVGRNPAIHFDMPLPSPAVETRGPDGLAVLPPESGRIAIAGHDIAGDGVVFVKCA